jgi:hypothetical protein
MSYDVLVLARTFAHSLPGLAPQVSRPEAMPRLSALVQAFGAPAGASTSAG